MHGDGGRRPWRRGRGGSRGADHKRGLVGDSGDLSSRGGQRSRGLLRCSREEPRRVCRRNGVTPVLVQSWRPARRRVFAAGGDDVIVTG